VTGLLHDDTVVGLYQISTRLHDLAAELGVTGSALARAHTGLSTRERTFLAMWSIKRPNPTTLRGYVSCLGVDPETTRFYTAELEAICPAAIAWSKT
jgi:hypothetical protein